MRRPGVRLTTTKAGGPQQTVVSNIEYHPFGGVKAYTLGNGRAYTRGIDLDGRIQSYTLGGTEFTLGYDDASRILFITQTAILPIRRTRTPTATTTSIASLRLRCREARYTAMATTLWATG